MDTLIGKTLSHYRIVEKIGAGGMGEVYRARDTRLGRDVAIKVISPELTRDPERIKRFEQEARAAGALSHPNVCAVHDVGEYEGSPFVVMELLQGESLHEKLAAGPIPVRKALDYVAQAAHGLAAAHEKGIVHRDPKPANLFVTRDGRVKVLDFGLAKLTRPEVVAPSGEAPRPVAATETGVLLGTVGYMSPEQVRGEPADGRSDLFALGAILYELLTGKRAFHGATYVETLSAILHSDPPPLATSGRAIPAGLEPVVRRCLEKSAAERFQSASDLAFDLEHASGIGSGDVAVGAQGRPRSRGRVWIPTVGSAAIALALLAAGRLSVDEPRVDLAPYRLTPFANQLFSSGNPVWSRDGKSIAFMGWVKGEARWQVWVQGIDAPSPVQISREPLAPYYWLNWSPDSRLIYCNGSYGDTDGISRISVEGGEPVLVQPGALVGSLSPDGSTLVMLAQEAPDKDIRLWIASPPDAPRHLYEPVPLTLKSVEEQPQVAFSPDGRSVMVSVWGDNGRQCWLLPWPPGRGHRIPTLEGAARMTGLSWMPDSRHVVFSSLSDPEQPWSLYMADVRTGRQWPILVGNNPLMWLAASPGGRIAFTANMLYGDVVEVPLGGGPPRTLLGGGREDVMPAVSADGKQLVYVTNARGPMEIWARDMRDESVRRLVTPSDIPPDSGFATETLKDPVLSRDGRRLAFTTTSRRGGWLYISYAAGAAPVRATTAASGLEEAPTWSPEGDRLAYLESGGGAGCPHGDPGGQQGAPCPTREWRLEKSPRVVAHRRVDRSGGDGACHPCKSRRAGEAHIAVRIGAVGVVSGWADAVRGPRRWGEGDRRPNRK